MPYQFNEELVEALRPGLKCLCITIILASVALDVAGFKWRWCANYILYIESIYVFCTLLIPSKDGAVTDMYIVMIMLWLFIALYTDTQG